MSQCTSDAPSGRCPRSEEHEVVTRRVIISDVAQCGLPELGLALEIVDAKHDRADAQHLIHCIPELRWVM